MSPRSIPLPVLSQRYDELYAKGQEILDKHNPCDVQGGLCLRARRDGITDSKSPNNFCCGSCIHLGPNGCTTKNLACKLFFCGRGVDQGNPQVRAMSELYLVKTETTYAALDSALSLFCRTKGEVLSILAERRKHDDPQKKLRRSR